mmetsp:Transcript_7187/g.31791  ORF Transcript_7187/g.31791 Transcript_7187/m.31791 type:complete len:173 (-) Transcript_7187:2725-3243(-)
MTTDLHLTKGWVTVKSLAGKERRWMVLRNVMLSCFDSDDSLQSTCLWSICIENGKVNAYTTTHTFKIVVMPKVTRFTVGSSKEFDDWTKALKAVPTKIREISRGVSSIDSSVLQDVHETEKQNDPTHSEIQNEASHSHDSTSGRPPGHQRKKSLGGLISHIRLPSSSGDPSS